MKILFVLLVISFLWGLRDGFSIPFDVEIDETDGAIDGKRKI